jgi:hypothetical protein
MSAEVTGTNIYLSNRIKRYQGIGVEVTDIKRHLGRTQGKHQFTPPTQAIGKSQPNREQRNISEHAGTRLNDATASLLIMVDDLVGVVQSRYETKR